MTFARYSAQKSRLEFGAMPVHDQAYLDAVRRFDLLWQSVISEQNQKEMQILISLIEQYEPKSYKAD